MSEVWSLTEFTLHTREYPSQPTVYPYNIYYNALKYIVFTPYG